MPKKIRELKAMLRQAGFEQVSGGGKGSHSKWLHANVPGSLTLSGQDGADAKPYQLRNVQDVIEKDPLGKRRWQMKSHYTVIIQWSEEDESYVVSLPEWGRSCKTHGATYEEAARNAQELLDLLLETHDPAQDGPLPEPKLFRFPGADVIDLPDDAPSKPTAIASRA